MTNIAAIIKATIAREGGYVNHPSDPGGATNFGITQAVARANGYTGDMRALSELTAIAIYRREYADKPGFTRVEALSGRIAAELFDTGVNMGPRVAVRFLQEWLNALNGQARQWPDIAEDGILGEQTFAALQSYLRVRGAAAEPVLICALNASQAERYKQLARARPANEDFVFGWLKNRVLA